MQNGGTRYRSAVLPSVAGPLLRLAVVRDARRHQDDQVAPVLLVLGEAEQLADDREAREERDARAVLVDRGDGQAADDRGLAVAHEELVVGLLLLEDEAEVGRRERLDGRALGV